MTSDTGKALVWHVPASMRTRERVRALVPAAQRGDSAALRELRELLTPEEWRSLGDVGLQALDNLAQAVVPGDLFLAEGIQRAAEALRADLLGPDPSPLERLLVERVVLCWIACSGADLQAAAAEKTGADPRRLAFHLRRQESAQRRYLAAIKALATVRRLLGPGMVQLNVTTGPQLNVAGAAPAPGASLAAASSRE